MIKQSWHFLGLPAQTNESLWIFNLCICLAHFIIVIVVLLDGSDVSLPVTTSYIAWKEINATGHHGDSCRQGNCYLETEFAKLTVLPDISLAGLLIWSHILSLSWPFLVLFDGPAERFYYRQRKRGRNTFRWVEYALSSPLMIVVIAAILGQADFCVFTLLAISTSTLMVLGYLTEVHIKTTPPITHITGWLLFSLIWAVITFTFVLGLNRSVTPPPPEVLAVIYPTYFTMLAFFGSFGVIQAVHVATDMKEKRLLDENAPLKYNAVEMWYAILSLSSKIALSILLYLLVRTRDKVLQIEFIK